VGNKKIESSHRRRCLSIKMHVAPLRRGELLITASVLHFSSERNSGLLRPSLNIHVNSYQATLRRTSNYLRGGKHGGAGRGGGERHQNKWSRPISRHFLRPLTQTISSAPRERLLLSSRGVNHPRGDTTLSLSLSVLFLLLIGALERTNNGVAQRRRGESSRDPKLGGGRGANY